MSSAKPTSVVSSGNSILAEVDRALTIGALFEGSSTAENVASELSALDSGESEIACRSSRPGLCVTELENSAPLFCPGLSSLFDVSGSS